MDVTPRTTPDTDPAATAPRPVTMTSAPAITRLTAPGRWPRRRRLAALGILLVLVLAVQLLVGWDPVGAPAWSAITFVAVSFAALALATFVPLPGQGFGLDIGCTPCAAAGGMLAIAGTWLAASSAYDGGSASLGLALAGAALVRRHTEPVTCQA